MDFSWPLPQTITVSPFLANLRIAKLMASCLSGMRKKYLFFLWRLLPPKFLFFSGIQAAFGDLGNNIPDILCPGIFGRQDRKISCFGREFSHNGPFQSVSQTRCAENNNQFISGLGPGKSQGFL